VAESLGAAAYFRKPSDLAEFLELGALIARVVYEERSEIR
jgi:hypothetical protein